MMLSFNTALDVFRAPEKLAMTKNALNISKEQLERRQKQLQIEKEALDAPKEKEEQGYDFNIGI